MIPKYYPILFFAPFIYVLYSENYYVQLKNYFIDYYEKNLIFTTPKEILKDGEILFTQDALKKYSNLNHGLYLSILGQVFDVTSGAKHYGPGETYHAFTGLDGSAAFITGDFTEAGLTDNVSNLSVKQIQSLLSWVEFYRKTYVYKGRLIGRYYNKDGSPTNERLILEEKVQIAKKNEAKEEEMKVKFPPCNAEWDEKTGTRVWCSKNSGGVVRDWIGVPRMFYEKPELKQYRCACINLKSKEFDDFKGMIKVYDGCNEKSASCYF